mmetsp:Transcript_78871/g.255496  ORF Transcript_78871/g.255496 Transcript_78871/m.255496 type:complete len:247 (-) Transcript_78871:22-762(-)
MQPRGQDLHLDVVEAEPPEDALPAVDDLRDLVEDLGVHEGHQEEVAVILVDVVVEHPDVVVAELHLRPLLARVHHQRQVAEPLVELLHVLAGLLLRHVELAAEDAVRLLRELPGRADAGVLRAVLLAAAEVVPAHALLPAALGLPEEDPDLAVLHARHGHDARALEGALLAGLWRAVLLRQRRLRGHRGDAAQREALERAAHGQRDIVLLPRKAVRGQEEGVAPVRGLRHGAPRRAALGWRGSRPA